MKYAVFSLAFLTAGQVIAGGGISVSVENFTQERRVAKAVLKVTNNLGKPANNVFVDCAFLNKEKKAVDVSSALIEKISTNDHAYDKASIVTDHDVQYIECRVAKFD
ncbi:hypothetical protein GOL30_26365 [Sinorhizobium medicae]|uniref:hypothetical protein n=1 Tax=Rhizobium meliloti TaxID=382 RepID=UPI000FD8620A|nr:hypothetical protein [Sinorhizobium meliloti]MDX0432680.1 hypothetical protein [Sinorhizobium medicae]MDX0992082.1 hypothetical protein [Sinorhizobium medicae]MDX1078214.1 hypothetical protein [Sinorhizobium medicae]RVG43581.1 hypothetical protein CN226_32775 [Sinorhizobium meliloti]